MGLEFYGLLSVLVFAGVVGAIALNVVSRAVAGVVGVLVLLVFGAVGLGDVLVFVDWDVVVLVVLMGFYSVVLERSGLAGWVAEVLVRRVGDPRLLLYSAMMACGVLSLALENAVTVFVFAPLAFQLARALSVSPVPLLVGMALAAGMAGSATMIGDPPAMIAAGRYQLEFQDFIVYEGRPSMFFITIIPMALAVAAFTMANFRSVGKPVSRGGGVGGVGGVDRVFALEALFFLLVKAVLLSLRKELGIPLSAAALVALSGVLLVRLLAHRDWDSVRGVLAEGFDVRLPVFLSSVFVLSNALKKHSVTDAVAGAMLELVGGDLLSLGVAVFAVSAALSAFIENIPVTLTLLPVADALAERLSVSPLVLAWGVLSGLTAGGGWTYIGSGANVVAVHILEREGWKVTFGSFVKTALFFNIVNTASCAALYVGIWLLW